MPTGHAAGDHVSRAFAIVEARPSGRTSLGWGISVTTHVLGAAALLLLPLYWHRALPQVVPMRLGVLLLQPAGPLPPRGEGRSPKATPNSQAIQAPVPHPRDEVKPEPEALPVEDPPAPESAAPQTMQSVGPAGGVPGDPNGVRGGTGESGGQRDGCSGCSGEGPVGDYDQGPLIVLRTQPIYPQAAFVKRAEGVVVLELLIDSVGNVTNARVTSSQPLFDDAARACVLQWKFKPARKQGHSVATLAVATVSFKIH